jgi:HPt (histidine-containing phosphotransfer) domain-containing protein
VDLNIARLDDITGGRAHLNVELMQVALEDADTAIGLLASALVGRDATEAAERAHQLKGVCANVGAERLSEAARHLERAMGEGDWAAASVIFDEVLAALTALRGVAAAL